MVQDFGASREALISLITAKKTMEREYNANLEELKKWDEKIGLANRSGKIELADEALNRRNFYANTVASIKQHIKQMETKINFAKQKLSSAQNVSSYSAELLRTLGTFEVDSNLSEFEKMELKIFEMEKEDTKFWIRTEEENKIQDINVVEVSSNTFDAFSSQNSSLNNALTKAIKETEENIGQSENQHQELKSQYLQFQKKGESFHTQALDFMEKGESNAASIALSSEVTTKNLLNSLEIQINNQMSLISTLKRHLQILKNLENNSKGIFQSQDDCIDLELENLRRQLREL